MPGVQLTDLDAKPPTGADDQLGSMAPVRKPISKA